MNINISLLITIVAFLLASCSGGVRWKVDSIDEPFITFYVYPGDAGHNYGDIEEEGFPKRIYKRGDKVEVV